MMVEFSCTKCGYVKLEPSQLHEDPRNPQTCTACAVKACRPAPPPPPFMRIGYRGETVNPQTGERIPPSTTEHRNRPTAAYDASMMVFVVVLVSLGFLLGWMTRGGV